MDHKWAAIFVPPIDPIFSGRKPSKIHNLDGTLIPINISYLTFWNILKPLETSFIPDWPMKRKDLSFLGCNSRLAWAIIFERLETIILFLINEFAMNQRISFFFLRNFIGDSKLVWLDETFKCNYWSKSWQFFTTKTILVIRSFRYGTYLSKASYFGNSDFGDLMMVMTNKCMLEMIFLHVGDILIFKTFHSDFR